mmetsp:Transcript_17671/g.12594  ORF Transcript_17671/g.12594 Transcript_17671/m.12594 type:complete len:83 (+) Transcript_17671:1289-1537(+)
MPSGEDKPTYVTAQVTWYNISSLTFEIQYNEPILSTRANTITFSFDNYNTEEVDEQIDLAVYFSPNVDLNKLDFTDATTLVI